MITIAFGFCFRSTDPEDIVPFSTWAYSPPYLPKKNSITVATNSGLLSEPMLFQIPFAQRLDRYPPQKLQPLNYRLGMIRW